MIKTLSPSLKIKSICLIICTWVAMGIPEIAKSQTSNTFSGWVAVFSTFTINQKFSIHLEGNLRSNNEWEQIQTLIFRTGLNYKIKPNQTITAGYAFVSNLKTVNGIAGYSPEDRIWEQYSNLLYFPMSKHFTSLQNRFRLEQRFIGQPEVKGDELVNDGFAFAQRLRYFLRAIVPVGKTANTFKKGTYISLQNEVFLNIGNTSAVNGKFFDQNRAYFSVGYRFSPKNDTEIGYMYQYISGKGAARTNNSIIQLASYIRL
jgi:hypothetical protein